MAKWYSVLFSDIRNKLGDQVVFGNWKGRGYMRTYVIPANPKTNAQEANRKHLADTVLIWQTYIKANPAAVKAWNAEALKEQISGFNLFTKYGRQSYVTASYANGQVTGSYKIGFAPSSARITILDETGTEVSEILGAGQCSESGTFSKTVSLLSGTYYVAIIYAPIEGYDGVMGTAEAMVCRGKPDEATGQFVLAKFTVS